MPMRRAPKNSSTVSIKLLRAKPFHRLVVPGNGDNLTLINVFQIRRNFSKYVCHRFGGSCRFHYGRTALADLALVHPFATVMRHTGGKPVIEIILYVTRKKKDGQNTRRQK